MLPQATITVVETKKGSRPTSSGLDLLFVAAAQQHSNRNRAVSDCASTITSLSSDVDLSPKEEQQPPPVVIQQCTPSKIFFPEVLMDMLSNKRFASIISWNPDGKSFLIKSRHEFKERVLPLYFQSNFDSFLRKLKRWGFEKDKIRRRGNPSIEFSHKYFLRDEAGLCLRMRCKSGPGEVAEDSCDANEDQQEVMRSSSLPEDNVMRQKGALVDHLMNQQASQKRLLEEINKAALSEKLAALSAIRRERTYDQAPTAAEQFMSQRELLLMKQRIVAAKRAQLARKLSEYMASPHRQQEITVHETQRDYQQLTQLQRFDQVLDANSRSDDAMARYYRPLSGSFRTQYSREALRAAILAKRQELGLPPPTLPTQSMRLEEITMMEPRFFQRGAASLNVSAPPTFPTRSLLAHDVGILPQADRWIP